MSQTKTLKYQELPCFPFAIPYNSKTPKPQNWIIISILYNYHKNEIYRDRGELSFWDIPSKKDSTYFYISIEYET